MSADEQARARQDLLRNDEGKYEQVANKLINSVKRKGSSPRSRRHKTVPRNDRFIAVMTAAEQLGLLGGKSARIAGRISPKLVELAKRRTGIAADTDLIEFALASVALDDDFGEAFLRRKGSVDPTLKLGF